jgi:hypothetical protein
VMCDNHLHKGMRRADGCCGSKQTDLRFSYIAGNSGRSRLEKAG